MQYKRREIMEKFVERLDLVRYENDDDIIVIRPSSWELCIKDKETGEEYYDDFDSKSDALEEMNEEIEASKEDENDEVNEKDDDNDESYETEFCSN
jgi:hypothetical protein